MSRSARPDEPPPEFFVDRSLGSRIVPEALRRAGLTAHAMADVYPNLGEDLADETWIPEVTARGWIILLKDDRVRSNPAERAAILDSAARVFCVTRGNLTGAPRPSGWSTTATAFSRQHASADPTSMGSMRTGWSGSCLDQTGATAAKACPDATTGPK